MRMPPVTDPETNITYTIDDNLEELMLIYAAFATMNETATDKSSRQVWTFIRVHKCNVTDF